MSRSAGTHWLHWFRPWGSFVFLSLTLACLALILSRVDAYRAVDSLMLRFLPPEAPARASAHGERVEAIVLMVSNQLFESRFRGITPLDRAGLAGHVRELGVAFQCQRVFVFDFDFVPPAQALGQPPAGGDPLDNALVNLAESSSAAGPSCPSLRPQPRVVILAAPGADASQEVARTRWTWRHKMEACGIRFADAELLQDPLFGGVTRYCSRPDRIGDVAFEARGRPANVPGPPLDGSPHCTPREEALINQPDAQRRVSVCALTSSFGSGACAGEYQRVLEPGTVVFFGGNYQQNDRYMTAFRQEKAGVEIHALAFVSRIDPLKEDDRKGVGLDFLIGLSYAAAAAPVTGIAYRARQQHRHLLAYLALLCNVLLLVGYVMVVFGQIFPAAIGAGLWVNPMVILFWLFIHGLLHDPGESGHDTARGMLAYALCGMALLALAAAVVGSRTTDGAWARAMTVPIATLPLIGIRARFDRRAEGVARSHSGAFSEAAPDRWAHFIVRFVIPAGIILWGLALLTGGHT